MNIPDDEEDQDGANTRSIEGELGKDDQGDEIHHNEDRIELRMDLRAMRTDL